MAHHRLNALSPLDGRYASKLQALHPFMSEFGLIRERVFVECQWLAFLTNHLPDQDPLSTDEHTTLTRITAHFDENEAEKVKTLEAATNHDVKAVEYYIRDILNAQNHERLIPLIHFACTSEDINNLSYALMLKKTRDAVLLSTLESLMSELEANAGAHATLAMLSRTHGQTASPTTLGKEFRNVVERLNRQLVQLRAQEFPAKINGAVGNFNAHQVSYPELDWPNLSSSFIESLGLTANLYTTQIEPHDGVAELLHNLMRINTILIDFSRDSWSYISIGYFNQKRVDTETGSSTMPHKINPIDFENAEGNLGIANALADHLAQKLPISRWQRDLSDSTVLRNLGVVFGHSLLAYQSLAKGLSKLEPNAERITDDLIQHPEVLTEAIQTVMRRYGIADAYEQLKNLSRGKALTQNALMQFIQSLEIPENIKQKLLKLAPTDYIGLAVALTKKES